MDSLVSTGWLADELGAEDLVVLDASWHLPDAKRDAAADFAAGHLPGARFLDLGTLVDRTAPFDNTLPPEELFGERMAQLGVSNASRVVVYDDSAIRTAARAWFMLHLFGHAQVAVLDGGLAQWKAEARPLSAESMPPSPGQFSASLDATRLRDKAEVLANIASGSEQLVDARGPGRFTGAEAESRPGLASGHIPGARNVPYASLFQADGSWKDAQGIMAAFAAGGIDPGKPVITSCGSGMTACVLAFALHRTGKSNVALYDGSWAEWGLDPALPKATGPA